MIGDKPEGCDKYSDHSPEGVFNYLLIWASERSAWCDNNDGMYLNGWAFKTLGFVCLFLIHLLCIKVGSFRVRFSLRNIMQGIFLKGNATLVLLFYFIIMQINKIRIKEKRVQMLLSLPIVQTPGCISAIQEKLTLTVVVEDLNHQKLLWKNIWKRRRSKEGSGPCGGRMIRECKDLCECGAGTGR